VTISFWDCIYTILYNAGSNNNSPGFCITMQIRHHVMLWCCYLLVVPHSGEDRQLVCYPFPATLVLHHTNKKILHGLSPRENYTERATAACRRSDCQLFADRGCHVVRVTDPYGRILGFLDRSRYFLSSSSSVVFTRLSGPRSRPTNFFLVVPGIEPGPPDL
jgi:hypothetical protein